MLSKTIASTLDQLRQDFDKQASSNAKGRPKQPKKLRTKDEIHRKKEELYQKYIDEIDELLAAFYAVMKEKDADSIGALYARHSSHFQDSIIDQIRVILEDAVRKKIYIPRENVCFDIAIRGCKERRPGLIALRKLVASGKAQAVMAFATSRLYRRTYRSLQFVEEELVERGIRGIFVKSNIDTAEGDHWRTLLQALASNDEAQVRHSVAHIQASQEGLFVRRMVHTGLSLGFTGEVVVGEFTRRQRPRRRIVIDPETARWIVRIFYWYVVEGISIPAIARKLNADPDAPAPTKSTTGLWSRTSVIRHLANAEYRGWWVYGAKETKWLSKQDYAVQVARESPLKEGQFEELRIVPDDCWYAAQKLLDTEHGDSGRKSQVRDRNCCPNFLRQLFVCPDHQRKLAVGGAKGCVLLCPTCRFINTDERPLFTHLNRKLAIRLTCEKLVASLEPTDELVASIVAICQRESASLSQAEPESLTTLRTQLNALLSTIEFNRRNPGISDEEQRRTESVLKDLRCQQNELLARLRSVESAMTATDRVPDREAVIEFLEMTRDQLQQCLTTKDETELRNGRRIIDDLIGGTIELHQIGKRVKSKGYLQGRFQIDTVAFAVERLTGMRLVESSAFRDAVIDYKRTMLIDEQSETAKRLWEDGLLHVEIAEQMGCIPPYVTKLIQHWHDQRGLPRPNNKKRRKSLKNKQQRTPLYKQIANQVQELMEAGLSNLEIARLTKTSDTNVAKAIKWWYEKRDLPVPTAADRRNQKLRRAMSMLDGGALLTDVANELDYSARGLKLALNKYAEDNGDETIDFRSRRGNAKSGGSANGKARPADSDAA
ncbi:recombinase family protein [Novipirellula rosea]|uniref:Recombinase domain-containing protein n=1 Tax=Novipirellula rosea TaxID=1031540 RepID=A0ABP8NEL3_9BACT